MLQAYAGMTRPPDNGMVGLRFSSSKRLVLAPAPCIRPSTTTVNMTQTVTVSNDSQQTLRRADQNDATPPMENATYTVYIINALRSPIVIVPSDVS